MSSTIRWQAVVPPSWVHDLVSGGSPLTYPGHGFVALEVGWGEPDAYLRGHVPGAVYLDTNLIERPPLWRFVPDADLQAVLERFGITRATTVVLYGDPMMGAARAAVAMLYAGVDDVRLLDGGLPAWRAAGFDVETTPRAPVAVAAFGGAVPLRPRLVVDKAAIRRMIDDPAGSVVVCTRSWAEHVGEISGYDAITARGRIRGSVWGHSGSDAHHVQDFEAPDGTLRDADELAALWAASGITGERHVAFYCGTGWRASLALFHAWRLGWPQASLYDPGWFEWAQDPAMPVETGPPQPSGRGAP